MTTTMPLIPLLILAHLTLTAATSGHIETVAAAPDTLRSFLHEEADERDEHYHQKPLARSDYPGKPQESAEEKMDVPDQTQHQATFKDGFPDGFAAGLENIEFNVPPPKGNRGFFEPPPENLAAAMSSLFDTEHPTLHPHVLQGSGSGQSGRAFHSGLQRRYDDNEPQVRMRGGWEEVRGSSPQRSESSVMPQGMMHRMRKYRKLSPQENRQGDSGEFDY